MRKHTFSAELLARISTPGYLVELWYFTHFRSKCMLQHVKRRGSVSLRQFLEQDTSSSLITTPLCHLSEVLLEQIQSFFSRDTLQRHTLTNIYMVIFFVEIRDKTISPRIFIADVWEGPNFATVLYNRAFFNFWLRYILLNLFGQFFFWIFWVSKRLRAWPNFSSSRDVKQIQEMST